LARAIAIKNNVKFAVRGSRTASTTDQPKSSFLLPAKKSTSLKTDQPPGTLIAIIQVRLVSASKLLHPACQLVSQDASVEAPTAAGIALTIIKAETPS